ncbi:hypothetical protein P7C73_g3193, partial [Tremellales sp. Uapishka_1]
MSWWARIMGNNQSSYNYRDRPRDYNGPLFGGHYKGDFSIRNQQPNMNKDLPAPPPLRSVQFGPSPPAWEFYKNAPSSDNTANTRYCSPADSPNSSAGQRATPPPLYNGHPGQGEMKIWNR